MATTYRIVGRDTGIEVSDDDRNYALAIAHAQRVANEVGETMVVTYIDGTGPHRVEVEPRSSSHK